MKIKLMYLIVILVAVFVFFMLMNNGSSVPEGPFIYTNGRSYYCVNCKIDPSIAFDGGVVDIYGNVAYTKGIKNYFNNTDITDASIFLDPSRSMEGPFLDSSATLALSYFTMNPKTGDVYHNDQFLFTAGKDNKFAAQDASSGTPYSATTNNALTFDHLNRVVYYIGTDGHIYENGVDTGKTGTVARVPDVSFFVQS